MQGKKSRLTSTTSFPHLLRFPPCNTQRCNNENAQNASQVTDPPGAFLHFSRLRLCTDGDTNFLSWFSLTCSSDCSTRHPVVEGIWRGHCWEQDMAIPKISFLVHVFNIVLCILYCNLRFIIVVYFSAPYKNYVKQILGVPERRQPPQRAASSVSPQTRLHKVREKSHFIDCLESSRIPSKK